MSFLPPFFDLPRGRNENLVVAVVVHIINTCPVCIQTNTLQQDCTIAGLLYFFKRKKSFLKSQMHQTQITQKAKRPGKTHVTQRPAKRM